MEVLGVDQTVEDVLTWRADQGKLDPALLTGDGAGGHHDPAAPPCHPLRHLGHVPYLQADVEDCLRVVTEVAVTAVEVGVVAGPPPHRLLLRQQHEGGAEHDGGLQLPLSHQAASPGLRQSGGDLLHTLNAPLDVVDVAWGWDMDITERTVGRF